MPWLPVLHTSEEDLGFFAVEIEGSQSWVALADGRVVAFAVLREGWLKHLYVDPERQGLGLGGALLTQVLSASPGDVRLWVFERNARAQEFYRKRGFEVVMRTDGSGNEEREPDVLMRHSLPPQEP